MTRSLASNRIGSTKILEHIWVVRLKSVVSYSRGVNTGFFPTQLYDVTSGRIGNRFVGIILMELDRIWNYQWNAERVVIFQTVLFQRFSGVFRSRNIHDQIDSLLDL